MAGLARIRCTGKSGSLAALFVHKPCSDARTPPVGHVPSVHISPIEDSRANAPTRSANSVCTPGRPAAFARRAGVVLRCGNRRDASLVRQKHSIRTCCPSHPPGNRAGLRSAAGASANQQERSRKHIAGVSSDGLYRSLLAIIYKTLLTRSPVPTCLRCARQPCSPRFGQCRLWPHRRPPAC